ncbi:T9SS sorting signal type C domain-containing protein [Flavobacterium sp. KJJ]|uniref:T9SS sorting signal type C domain-containing protein n=1 Tax=Flavobacterium sp. KJJ TaxID=1270193 RepID=UPI0012F94B17|nr:T9SS sorting signal type C domain-containing protein [Flavobacterium sp. KJJ]
MIKKLLLNFLFLLLPFFGFSQLAPGSYIINSSQPNPFKSLASAITSLNNNNGISGPVTLLIDENQTVSSTIVINQFAGLSATNTLTIKPNTAKNITITGNMGNSSTSPLIKLDATDYVTIDGSNNNTTSSNLIITNTSLSNYNNYDQVHSAILWLANKTGNGATNNTIKNIQFVGSSTDATSATSAGIVFSETTNMQTAETTSNSNNNISNNVFTKMKFGIWVLGGTGSSAYNQNLTIDKNTFGSSTDYIVVNAIKLSNTQNTIVTGNTIAGVSMSSTATFISGISLYNKSLNCTIAQNKISGIRSASLASGIHINIDSSITSNLNIYNNFITNIASSGNNAFDYNNAGHGIYVAGGNKVNLFFNTVVLNVNQNVLCAALFINSASNLDVRNNIFYNSQTGSGLKYAVYSIPGSNAIFSAINRNDYITSTGGLIGHLGSSDAATIANWRTLTGKDQESLNIAPTFTSTSDFHLVSGNVNNENLAGIAISGITTDIDGQTRTKPYMGADEIFSCTPPAITTQPTAPTATCSGSGIQTISVTATGTTIAYTWKKAGTAVTNGGVFSGQGTATLTLTNPTTADQGNYTVEITGACTPAVTSSIVAVTVNAAPAITTQPTAPTPTCPGSGTQTISVIATGTGLTYVWKKGTTTINNGGVYSGQGSNTLTITNTTAAEEGSYTVEITGTCSPAVTSNAVTVSTIVTDRGRSKGGKHICPGDATPTMTVYNFNGPGDVVYSDPSKITRWEYTDDPSNGANTWVAIPGTAGQTSISPTGTLTALRTYRAVAKNGSCAEQYSIETRVDVDAPTVITSQSTATQSRCQNVAFSAISVIATGTNLQYQWYSNNVNSNSGGTSLGTAAQTNTYTPSSATIGTLYYYCIVRGNCGQVTSAVSGAFITNAFPSAPVATVTSQPNCASSTGTITVTAPTGTGITYSINGTDYFTSGVFSSVAVGSYTVTAKNSSDCISTMATQLQVQPATSKTWNGSASSNWSVDANWTPSGVPTSSDCVVIPAGVTNSPVISGTAGNFYAYTITVNDKASLTVQSKNTLNVTNAVTVLSSSSPASTGNLTFEDSANLLQTSTDPNINTGVINYQRTSTPIRQADYVYWSSPVKGQNLYNISPLTASDKYLSWETTKWLANPSTNIMIPGKGYIIRGPETYSNTARTAFSATFTGTPNNGNISGETAVASKYYLVGNPYPSALDADAFIMGNNFLVGTLYFWTHNTPVVLGPNYKYNSDDYATYNLSGGTGTKAATSGTNATGNNINVPSGYIGTGQSFFVGSKAPGTISFTNLMRKGDNRNTQFFKPSTTSKTTALEKNRVWLNMTNEEGAFKQMMVGYIEGATNDYEDMYDGLTFDGNKYIDFYSINNTNKLVIQGRALPFADTDLVPLGYRTTVEGEFTISIDQADGSLSTQPIYLEDKTTGTINDLRAGNYTFKTVAGTFADRFVLRYTSKTLGTGDFENIENGILVSVKDKIIKVLSSKENIKEINVYDISGRLLFNKNKIDQTEFQISNLQSSNQVLIVKITLDNSYIESKKIIFN